MSAAILHWISFYSAIFNMDPKLVQAIIQYESNGVTTAMGAKGEVGLMQLMPSDFPYTKTYLKDPQNNIRLGVAYLARLREECPHKLDNTFIICYNLGIGGAAKIKHPKQFKYYQAVMLTYDRLQGK